MDRLNWDGTPEGFEQSRPELAYTDEVKAATDHLYEKVKDIITPMEWPAKAPLIHAINQLKAEKNAVILAHNYMTADIFHCVGDLMGDSLALARMAAESEADIIVQAGVHFMAETAKVLAPEKKVLRLWQASRLFLSMLGLSSDIRSASCRSVTIDRHAGVVASRSDVLHGVRSRHAPSC